jgi:hypothetical protein
VSAKEKPGSALTAAALSRLTAIRQEVNGQEWRAGSAYFSNGVLDSILSMA